MIGPEWLYHPLGLCPTSSHWQYVACRSYNFWSGIEAAAEKPWGWLAFALVWARHHNCGKRRCWRLGHAHPGHGRPVCRRHYHHADAGPGPRDGGDTIGHTTTGGDW